ncbi:MAG: membrane protein insertase YidC [bacterium]|nr:membrane protein insertase YidC [bacterium]
MDKRTSLAIVIMLGLTIVWSVVSKKDTPPAAENSTIDDAIETALQQPAAQQTNEAADNTIKPGLDFEPKLSNAGPHGFIAGSGSPIVVETSLYKITIDPAGATVSNWIGKEFKGANGDSNVELVPDFVPKEGDLIKFENGTLSLAQAGFVTSSPSKVVISNKQQIRFEAETNSGIVIGKTFTFNPDSYDYDVAYDVNRSTPDVNSELSIQLGEPVSAVIGWYRGIESTEEAVKTMAARSMHSYRSFAMIGQELAFRMRKDLDNGNTDAFGTWRGSVRFAGVQNKYFMTTAFIPNSLTEAHEGIIKLGGDCEASQQSFSVELPLRENHPASISFYHGPSKFNTLAQYNCSLEKAVNLGWKWVQPISTLMLHVMNWIHKYVPNYGWVIVIISILSKLVFFPLTSKGTKSMKKMQESQARLKPKMDALKKKCGGDSKRYNQEMMQLYKEEGVNPMAGMAGCLPMLIQMPVFIALYQVLYNMVDLRFTPFVGWITDLSQPDALFALPFTLPLIGSSFNLLPILMALATYYQTKLTPQAGAQGQMAAMQNIMPIMMLFFLYNMPSGLVIYWTINTVMTALQTWWVGKKPSAPEGVATT